MAKYILKEMAEGMADGHKTLYPKMQTYSLHDYETVIEHINFEIENIKYIEGKENINIVVTTKGSRIWQSTF